MPDVFFFEKNLFFSFFYFHCSVLKYENEQAKDAGQEKALDDFHLPKLQNCVIKVFTLHFFKIKRNKEVLPMGGKPVARKSG